MSGESFDINKYINLSKSDINQSSNAQQLVTSFLDKAKQDIAILEINALYRLSKGSDEQEFKIEFNKAIESLNNNVKNFAEQYSTLDNSEKANVDVKNLYRECLGLISNFKNDILKMMLKRFDNLQNKLLKFENYADIIGDTSPTIIKIKKTLERKMSILLTCAEVYKENDVDTVEVADSLLKSPVFSIGSVPELAITIDPRVNTDYGLGDKPQEPSPDPVIEEPITEVNEDILIEEPEQTVVQNIDDLIADAPENLNINQEILDKIITCFGAQATSA
jgi:hypothetical protein